MSKNQPVDNELTRYQTSQSVVMCRNEIKNAPYNPRKISSEALKSLKANIKQIGLLGGIVVNKTTGHLVSGHQRLTALDSLERRNDYSLRVELVEMDEKTEKEQNIFMNSASVQGEFDLDMLREILPEIEYENAGLTIEDLSIIGVIDTVDAFAPDNLSDELNENYESRKQATKDLKSKIKSGYNERYETEPVVTLSFSSVKAKQAFMQRFGYDLNAAFINGDMFSEQIERIE